MSRKVIRVRGTGGGEFDIDDPTDDASNWGGVMREQIEKGDLIVVPPAQAPKAARTPKAEQEVTP